MGLAKGVSMVYEVSCLGGQYNVNCDDNCNNNNNNDNIIIIIKTRIDSEIRILRPAHIHKVCSIVNNRWMCTRLFMDIR